MINQKIQAAHWRQFPEQPLGRRIGTTGTTVTNFVYDAMGKLAAEYGGPQNPNTGTTYLTDDHLGSTRVVTRFVGHESL